MLKLNAGTLVFAAVLGGLAAGAAIVACGGGSGAPRGGTGGTSAATGGISGGAGNGGVSGATGGSSGGGISCSSPVTATASLTDFSDSDWNAVSGKWGVAPAVTGSVFGYHGAASMHTATVTAGAFSLSGNVMPGANDGYMGGGLSFDVCASATAFTGIEFAVSGTTGGCALELQLQTRSTKSVTNGGGCSSGCSSATKRALATTGTVRVNFSDLTGAAPGAFNPAELIGIQWQLTIPPGVDGGIQSPCAVALTFDNVKFVN